MSGGNAPPSLLAALLWGGGDFAGGSAVKAAGGVPLSAVRVVVLGHTASLLVLLPCMLLSGHAWHGGAPALWALAGGAIAGLSLTGFYMALARGAMGASAAISGVLAAAVPAAVSSVIDGRPTAAKLIGFLLAFAAIWLIAASGGRSQASVDRMATVLAIASGIGFGLYFVTLRFSSPLGELEPMTLARCGSASTALGLVWLLQRRRSATSSPPLRMPGFPMRAVWLTLAGATLDTSANLLFVLATRSGRLDVAAVLASLYPVPTILLAAILLRERLEPRQWMGMVLGATAVVLVAL